MRTQPVLERRRLVVTGLVQGVGFRPFVRRLADELGLAGFVLNDGRGVVAEVEGDPARVALLVDALRERAPGLARVERIEAERLAPLAERGFRIVASSEAAGAQAAAAIGADVATCEDCLRELHDPADRRFNYPFINCTQCGPRFTIVVGVPYDRERTTMARFELCARCRAEYEDPADRRFHAEPIACPDCGPQLVLETGASRAAGEQALAGAASLLAGGAIVAVKGLGGYHLACDATDAGAVARLRARKHREEKSFAVITTEPEELATVGEHEWELLRSPARPVVLLRHRADSPLAGEVAPGNPSIGVMLPYAPVHHLLCERVKRPLVMTSGNRSDEPIAIADEEARQRLGAIADAFLVHDREIHRRCEDSVVRAGLPLRRSRGFVPGAVALPVAAARPLIAAGAELKATFCVARGGEAFLSPHLGDLDSELAYRAFRADLELYLEMLAVEPAAVACDLHPDYLSTRWAREREAEGLELIAVQHHHAHAAACLAEHGREGPALALVFDGTGFGPDGTIWGGELLRFDLAGFERVAHLEPVALPGGEAAIREPWRSAATRLELAGRPLPERWAGRWHTVREAHKVNAPLSSGMGRLFDAVSALLGVRDRITYEGQAAVELEWLAGETVAAPYQCRVEDGLIHGGDLFAAADDDLREGRSRAGIAAAFHEGVADAAARACAAAAHPRTVVLSGGTFQNLRLLASVETRLRDLGFEVLCHRRVPCNDGGVSYGQAAIAARRSS